MIDYRVRSVSLLNLINDMNKGALIPDAYFQRNLVWRESHKKDFISTILLGYPFPEIFISKGKVDVESMTTVSCIVDGQQRTNAISKFIDNEFDVDGRFYRDLREDEKSKFLKYEIAVIELDIENDNPQVKDIFQRINRTSNSLTIIEKLASEYSTSEFMLVAKLLTEQIDLSMDAKRLFKEDPAISEEFYAWARPKKLSKITKLFTSKNIFSISEVSKKNNLMYVLNIMSTILEGLYNRNDRVVSLLNDYSVSFPKKDHVIDICSRTADVYASLKLKPTSYWYNKANFFSLFVAIASHLDAGKKINIEELRSQLESFTEKLPEEYKLAASQGVNNTNERAMRSRYIDKLLLKSDI
tara:strand:+ start:883 stop:1950 length:1068 start_codon:yes stop_codon:yes gene_type:complete